MLCLRTSFPSVKVELSPVLLVLSQQVESSTSEDIMALAEQGAPLTNHRNFTGTETTESHNRMSWRFKDSVNLFTSNRSSSAPLWHHNQLLPVTSLTTWSHHQLIGIVTAMHIHQTLYVLCNKCTYVISTHSAGVFPSFIYCIYKKGATLFVKSTAQYIYTVYTVCVYQTNIIFV